VLKNKCLLLFFVVSAETAKETWGKVMAMFSERFELALE
jgi:hypothetical protein